jgi:hypothetical protein
MQTDEGATKAARRASATKAIRRWYEQAPKKRTKLGWIRRFNLLVKELRGRPWRRHIIECRCPVRIALSTNVRARDYVTR